MLVIRPRVDASIDPYNIVNAPQRLLCKALRGVFYAISSAGVRPDSRTSARNALWSA